MWNTNSPSGGGSGEAFIKEGNLEFLIVQREKLRVTPLTEEFDIEQIMSSQKMTREQAMEHVYTELAREKWLNPFSYWEHSVPSIANQRFFSTVPCQGRANCSLCGQNNVAESQGVTENKLKPFPVRKKFVVPVWVYSLEKVLYLRQNEKFINEMGQYINQNGSAIDFDVWKEGRGFQTTYHSMYLGPRTATLPPMQIIMPNQIDLKVPDEEIARRIGNTPPASTTPKSTPPPHVVESQENANLQPVPNFQIDVGAYVIPFGPYKGQTLEAIYQAGDKEFLKYLVKNGDGLVKQKVEEFLDSK